MEKRQMLVDEIKTVTCIMKDRGGRKVGEGGQDCQSTSGRGPGRISVIEGDVKARKDSCR